MKRDHRLLITGLAVSVLVGTVPALGQESTKGRTAPPATVTPAAPPAAPAAVPPKPELSPAERRAEINQVAKSTMDTDRKSTRLNSSHIQKSRMPSSA